MRAGAHRTLLLILGIHACLAGKSAAQDSARTDALAGSSEEELLELIDDEEASARVAETLSWLHENPIDLNSAQRDELLSIPGLGADEAEALLRLRESGGPFESVDQICRLPGGEEIAARIRPYVIIQKVKPNRTPDKPPVVLFSSRLAGFVPGTISPPPVGSLGNLAKSISRVTLRLSRHLQAGFLLEKDSGERVRDGFSSGYISFRGSGVLEQVLLGDFSIETGHGLVLWRGSSFGRSGTAANGIRNHAARLVPNHLADESRYLRGGAVALKTRLWTLPVRWLLALSRTSLAAKVDEEGIATSLYTSGLFRTEEELKKRNSIHELLAGSRLECELPGKGSLGLTYYRSTFDLPVHQQSPNEFSGLRSDVAGGDVTFSLGETRFFGECARTAEGGMAWLAGFVIPLDSLLRATIAYRNFSEDFHNPHAGASGVLRNTTNERGISIDWSVRLAQGFVLQGFADQCKIPTRTYTSFLPRTLSEFLVQAAGCPVPWMRLSVAFRMRKSEAMASGPGIFSSSMKTQGRTERTSIRFSSQMEALPCLNVKIRAEHGEFRRSGSTQVDVGDLVAHTFCYTPPGMACECGVAFFQSDSYDARLYDYEANTRGSIASPPLYGKGSRWHLVAAWEPGPWIRLAAKYAVTMVERSPVKKELGVQAELRF